MKFNTTKVLQNLILFGLIIVPIFTFTEVYELMYHSAIKGHSRLLTPWYIKAIKDFIIISIILIAFFSEIINRRAIKINYYFLILLFLLCISILISFTSNDIKVIISGIRWVLPIFLIPSLINRIDKDFLVKIAKVLQVLVLIGFLFQLNQLYTLDSYFGLNQLGFSLRNPGFFTSPSAMSIFLLLSLWFSYNFLDKTISNKIFIYYFSPFCIFLAGSATGILTMALFYLSIIFFKTKQKKIMFLFATIMMVIIAYMLPEITNRATLLDSLFYRLDLFNHINPINFIIGDRFGLATNTAILLKSPNALIADSLIVSMLINVGFLFLLTSITWVISKSDKSPEFFQFLIIVSLFSFNTILTEVYPANLLIPIIIVFFVSVKNNKILLGK
jgi:hypothetical protein